MTDEREKIIRALYAFTHQRPGLDPRNYGDWQSYRSESRDITRDLHHAIALLRFVELRPSISAENLRTALRGAYSGRLSWDGKKLDYCTGQYWPTEYRRAVCAVCASAIWAYFRGHCMPDPTFSNSACEEKTYNGLSAGEYLRRVCRREFGRAIAGRWFN